MPWALLMRVRHGVPWIYAYEACLGEGIPQRCVLREESASVTTSSVIRAFLQVELLAIHANLDGLSDRLEVIVVIVQGHSRLFWLLLHQE